MERSEGNSQESVLSFTVWVRVTDLRWTCLATDIFTHWVIPSQIYYFHDEILQVSLGLCSSTEGDNTSGNYCFSSVKCVAVVVVVVVLVYFR